MPQLVGVGVEELGVGNSVIAIAIKESAPVVDDNGWRRVVWLEWVLASVEAAAQLSAMTAAPTTTAGVGMEADS